MSETKWTKNQLKAIETPANVLVNAAAGSGKTAVLVERIIRKIVSDEASIQRLLIVTFARDAASQMQNRLKKALTKCIAGSTDAAFCARMRSELRLLNHSDITTIDAFCVNVVRKNFHLLGIDPGFKIIDTDEAKIMLYEELDEFVNRMYEEGDARICELSDCYSDGFSDYTLIKMMAELYQFTRSLPEPSEWMLKMSEKYKDFKNTDWFSAINAKIAPMAEALSKKTLAAAECMMLHALGKSVDVSSLLPDEEEILSDYDNNGLWESLKKAFLAVSAMDKTNRDSVFSAAQSFDRVTKQYMSGDHKDERKEIIDKYNEAYQIGVELLALCEDEYTKVLDMYEKGIYPKLSLLCEVVCEFEKYYFSKKCKKNQFEFNDLEHLCYRLLKDFEDVRAEYSGSYDEILMDEYQDTNALQDGIFDLILDKRFMVGDMKQSIYRFRNSDPFIFKGKDKLYSKNPDEGTRIILSENFRSRPQVLRSVNEIFKRIMSETAGEVEYDDTQELKWGNKDYTDEKNEKFYSELYILEGKDEDSDEDETNTRIEARFIASKIRKMIDDKFTVSDGTGERAVTAGDFVIIQSAVKSSGEIFISELKKAGLDAYAENEGYFDKTEVRLMLALLDVINNPLQDIPLVAVMRSILFGFSEDFLAKIRLQKKGSFFDAVWAMSESDDSECAKKCKSFCDTLSKWRNYAKYMTSDRLIWTIYEETDYCDIMSVLYNSEEARENLRLLFERARQFEKTGFRGLQAFVDYMKKMEKNAKMASATLISDEKNVVRIMTIHKSKGLEFPVCILAGAGKRFQAGTASKLLMHKDLGIGIDFVDAESGYYSHTAVQDLIKEAQKSEDRAEVLRKLYVGMTRAKEKLIVVGTIGGKKTNSKGEESSGYETEKQKWSTYYNSDGVMSPDTVLSVTRFLDLIAPIVLHHKKACGWLDHVIEYNPDKADDVTDDEVKTETEIDSEAINKLLGTNIFNKEKEYIPGKISVTGIQKLKEKLCTEDDISDSELEDKHSESLERYRLSLRRPAFMQDTGLTGAERGTAYHTVFSLIDMSLGVDTDSILAQIKRLAEDGFISEAERDCVKAEDISAFFKTELGKRIKSSGKVLREEPFEILIDSVTALGSKESREILLQGVIDCMFEEDGEIVIVDYKTDKGLSENEFIEHYKNQLTWYKCAAEKLTGKSVKEALLYSVEKKKQIRVI